MPVYFNQPVIFYNGGSLTTNLYESVFPVSMQQNGIFFIATEVIAVTPERDALILIHILIKT
ncbi:hypothetical protein [Morganella morganii IS15]|nr:hypothetical protein [Morganella morganii IS15]